MFYGRFLEFGGRTSGIPIPSIHYLYSIERSVFNCLKTRFQPPRNFPHLFKQILPNLNLPYVFLGARGGGSPTNQDTSWVRRTSSNICSDSATSAPSPVGKPTKRQAEEWEMFVWLLRKMCLFFFGGGVGRDAKLSLIFGGVYFFSWTKKEGPICLDDSCHIDITKYHQIGLNIFEI